MDSQEQAKKGPRSPKVDSPPDPTTGPGPESPTDYNRPSQMGSAYGATYGQGPMSISVPPPPSLHDAQMVHRFKLFMIGSIVTDLLNLPFSVVVAVLYYTALTRRKKLFDGEYIDIPDDLSTYNKKLTNAPRDMAAAGIPIAYILAGVCAVCLIIDAFCCLVVKSLRDPKTHAAILGWLVGTVIFILFTMAQAIILISILRQNHLIILDKDYAEFKTTKEVDSAADTLEVTTCYTTIAVGFIVLGARVGLVKPIFAMKNAVRGAAAAVFIPPEMPAPSGQDPGTGTGTGATSPTGTATTATSQNTGSPA